MPNTDSQPRSNSFLYILVFVGAALLALIIFGDSKPRTQEPEKVRPTPAPVVQTPAERARAHFYDLAGSYLHAHAEHPDRYWLVGDEKPGENMARVRAWTERTNRLLDETKDVSPLASEIRTAFPSFTVDQFADGTTQRFYASEEEAMAALEHPGLEVVIVPQMQAARYANLFPSNLYYRPEWHALSVVGIEVPDRMQAALIFHEMGHALRDRQGASSAHADGNSDLFIGEEVEMHELEGRVMNRLTEGKLEALFADIRSRATDPGDPLAVIAAVEPGDLTVYDTICGTGDAGVTMANIYAAQFFMALALDTVTKDGTGDVAARKIAVYRFFTGPPSDAKRHAELAFAH